MPRFAASDLGMHSYAYVPKKMDAMFTCVKGVQSRKMHTHYMKHCAFLHWFQDLYFLATVPAK